LQNLKAYKKVVQNRNKLLSESFKGLDNYQLEAWNTQLVEYGSNLIKERIKFIIFMNQHINAYYKKFSDNNEDLRVEYNSNIKIDLKSDSLNSIKSKFEDRMRKVKSVELERGTSIVGPHRDDLDFMKNEKSFREYGSQGENKTLIIVLKILEWLYFTNQKDKKPLMLLDDIFGELDRSRIKGLLNFLANIGQSFITTTLKDIFSDISNKNDIYLENTNIVYG
jgi:DNA replication and repair protein RecF